MVTEEQLKITTELLEQAKRSLKTAAECWELFRKSDIELRRSAMKAGIRFKEAETEFKNMYDAHKIAFEAALAYVDKMEREYEAMSNEIEFKGSGPH